MIKLLFFCLTIISFLKFSEAITCKVFRSQPLCPETEIGPHFLYCYHTREAASEAVFQENTTVTNNNGTEIYNAIAAGPIVQIPNEMIHVLSCCEHGKCKMNECLCCLSGIWYPPVYRRLVHHPYHFYDYYSYHSQPIPMFRPRKIRPSRLPPPLPPIPRAQPRFLLPPPPPLPPIRRTVHFPRQPLPLPRLPPRPQYGQEEGEEEERVKVEENSTESNNNITSTSTKISTTTETLVTT